MQNEYGSHKERLPSINLYFQIEWPSVSIRLLYTCKNIVNTLITLEKRSFLYVQTLLNLYENSTSHGHNTIYFYTQYNIYTNTQQWLLRKIYWNTYHWTRRCSFLIYEKKTKKKWWTQTILLFDWRMKEWWIEQEYTTKNKKCTTTKKNYKNKINRRREDLPQGPHNRQFSRPVRKTFSTSFYDHFVVSFIIILLTLKQKKNWFIIIKTIQTVGWMNLNLLI